MKRRIGIVLTVAFILVAFSLTAFAQTDALGSAASSSTTKLYMAKGYGAQFMASFVAKLTGLTVDEVLKLKSEGKTFYQIATSKGVTPEKFKDAVYQEKANLVDQKVKSGVITKEQADAIKAQIKDRISNCNGQGYANKPQSGFGLFGASKQ